jgi:tetratricopeptide (TPR) repeat protein
VTVRRSAAEALGNLEAQEAVSGLLTALSDESLDVQLSAAQALGRVNAVEAIPTLSSLLVNMSTYYRRVICRALSRLNAVEAVDLIAAIAVSIDSYSAQDCIIALLYLDPATAMKVLDQLAIRFTEKSWVEQLKGQMQWQLRNNSVALIHFHKALEIYEGTDNILALAHFYLEHDQLQPAQTYIDRAVAQAKRYSRSRCILSRAVVRWLAGEQTEALADLREVQDKNKQLINVEDLSYEDFWRTKALTALQEMLEQA